MNEMSRWEDPEQIDKDEKRFASKLSLLVKETARAYESHQAEHDVRNLAYYRGRFWMGDGHEILRKVQSYRASQNEIFPILDTIASSLAMELPQCELLKQTVSSSTDWSRDTDPTLAGKRVSACLNWMAEEDDLDETVFEWVLHALMFPKGVVKTAWSAELGRTVWENKLPWEVFFDPNAKHPKKAAWAFEYASVHWSEWKRRVDSGVYKLQEGKKYIRPDSYPRALVDRNMGDLDDYEARLRKNGLKEFVGIVEFWDFRRGMVYHLHPDTQQILMSAKAPYDRPYEVLVFHPGVGRIDGISDVDLMAPVQRDINELVNARKEIVHRLVRRMVVSKSLFKNETDVDNFKNSKTWEPVFVEDSAMGDISKKIFVTPEMDTTYAFKEHLAGNMDGIRRLAGEADYQRGVHKNIRTAAEAHAIRSSVEGRMNTRVNKLVKGVTRLFRKGLETLQWATRNQAYSNLDFQALVFATQDDAPPEMLAADIMNQMPRFRLLPFSPLMEDKVARRQHLVDLIERVFLRLPTEENLVEWREVVREVCDEYGLRPTIPKTLQAAAEETKAKTEAAGQMAAGGIPGTEAGPPPPIESGAPLPLPGLRAVG
jgi:hypothetical protein